jgi:hypothetical protein
MDICEVDKEVQGWKLVNFFDFGSGSEFSLGPEAGNAMNTNDTPSHLHRTASTIELPHLDNV